MFDHVVRPKLILDHGCHHDASAQIYRCDDRVHFVRDRNPMNEHTMAQKHLPNITERREDNGRQNIEKLQNAVAKNGDKKKRRKQWTNGLIIINVAQLNYYKLKATVRYWCAQRSAYDAMAQLANIWNNRTSSTKFNASRN